jgi:hypothetical protein
MFLPTVGVVHTSTATPRRAVIACAKRGRVWGIPHASSQPTTLLPSFLYHQKSNIAASTPGFPSHRRTRQNRRTRHSTYVHHGRPSCRMTGPAQRITLPLGLPRYVLPYRHLTVLQMNILRVFRHEVANYMASACTVETIDIAPSMEATTTPR